MASNPELALLGTSIERFLQNNGEKEFSSTLICNKTIKGKKD